MLTLPDKTVKKIHTFRDYIDAYGTNELSKWLFKAQLYSDVEVLIAYTYLRQEGWDKINEVEAADNEIIHGTLFLDPELKYKNKKISSNFSEALNRRITNAFTLSEIRKLGIKHMSPEEAEKLLTERENDRVNGKR